jgi:hypothetical protein
MDLIKALPLKQEEMLKKLPDAKPRQDRFLKDLTEHQQLTKHNFNRFDL